MALFSKGIVLVSYLGEMRLPDFKDARRLDVEEPSLVVEPEPGECLHLTMVNYL
jgi:hypothetical protein